MSTIEFGPFRIEYDYTPGDPGVTSGPPDAWRPPESSDYETTAVRWNYSAIGHIAELLDGFLAPVDLSGRDIGAFIRENLETPDGVVPESMFEWWLNSYHAALHEAIDTAQETRP